MEAIVSRINEVAKKLQPLKLNDDALIKALNDLSKEQLGIIRSYLGDTPGEKVTKIRQNVLGHLEKVGPITLDEVEQIKTDVKKEYSTNILRSWANFNIFYIFIYCDVRSEIKKCLKLLSKQLIDDLKLTKFCASKEVDFDGSTNFGSDRVWVALYNKKQPNQSSSLQLFISIYGSEIQFGLNENYNRDKHPREVRHIDGFSWTDMVNYFNQIRDNIVDDNKPITIWKLSPGENADYWDDMRGKGVASIGKGNFNYSGLSKSQITKLNPTYFEEHPSAARVVSLINKAKAGDIIYAFKGRKEVVGRGIIKGKAQYSHESLVKGTEHHNYLEVDWDECFESGYSLKNVVPIEALADISDRRQDLENILPSSSDNQNVENEDNTSKRLATNIILYGPPGTGKTYSTVDEALKIINKDLYSEEDRESNLKAYGDLTEEGRIVFTTFHQSYGYEDFIEGIKVETTEDGQTKYDVKPGVFKRLCHKAGYDLSHEYVIIIDEINRGNISKIFGELITLIEPEKRKGADEELSVQLPYSPERFSVPNNVHIIGTMNTADASLAKLDVALRRRFDFIAMPPKPKLLTDTKLESGEVVLVEGINLIKLLKSINERIDLLYDREHLIGHSFFMKLSNESTLEEVAAVFKKNIIPLLQEYFFDDWERIHLVLADHLKEKDNQFVREKIVDKTIIQHLREEGIEKQWEINDKAFEKINSYILIYNTSLAGES